MARHDSKSSVDVKSSVGNVPHAMKLTRTPIDDSKTSNDKKKAKNVSARAKPPQQVNQAKLRGKINC